MLPSSIAWEIMSKKESSLGIAKSLISSCFFCLSFVRANAFLRRVVANVKNKLVSHEAKQICKPIPKENAAILILSVITR